MPELLLAAILVLFFFAVLTFAARGALKHVINLSRTLRIPEFTIGFLFVGIIAIFPELSIGISSALSGVSSFGLGIVFGSNIADLALITGLVAFFSGGIKLKSATISRSNFFVFITLLPVALVLDGEISRIDGAILLLSFIFYVFFMLSHGNRKPVFEASDTRALEFDIGMLLIYIAIMLAAGHFITEIAMQMSSLLSVPLFFIGAVIAVGTCMPELVFALQASKTKHGETGLGDILGNVFADCLLTIGIIALISPIRPQNLGLVILTGSLMIAAMLVLVWFIHTDRKISKKEGAFLLALYFLFMALQWAGESSLL
ncbi:MAG: hypothetical protein AABW99_02910 [archaeon]